MDSRFLAHLGMETEKLREAGLYKSERIITSPQEALIRVGGADPVVNLCANNYLGLASHPALIETARDALRRYGYGMASVRFICGTQSVHKELEERLSRFLGTEDTILYSSCFDANGGVFEALLGEKDAVISDSLNHASIIDGIRLCRARRLRYRNNDPADLERALVEAASSPVKLIASDGVFSMDGIIADLGGICDLADRHGSLVMIDDAHATGFLGENGRGSHEYRGVMGRVDLLTGTLGKALGGASGGYASGRRELVDWLRQRSRPYLFSNTVAPVIAATTLKVLDLLESGSQLRDRLHRNTRYFRQGLESLGFDLVPGDHPIIPVMLGDARVSSRMSDRLLEEGVYAIGFSYPVVPEGKARIRTQMSAGHEREHLERSIEAFGKVGRELGVIP